MFSWLFPKKAASAAPATPRTVKPPPISAAQARADAAAKAQAKADLRERAQQEASAEWAPRLQAALGDDAALLQLALACPVLDIKRTAIEALVTEDSLRQAEREFRRHDRRIHQIAKRRYEAAVLQRETLASAQRLIANAEALSAQALVPLNHLVDLDRGWQALALPCLDDALQQRFGVLRAQLGAAVQAQVQQQQDAQRHKAEAAQLRIAEAAQQRTGEAAQLSAGEAAQPPATADQPGTAQAASAWAAVPGADPLSALAATDTAGHPTTPDAQATPEASGVADGAAALAVAPSAPPTPRPPRRTLPDADQRAHLQSLLAQAEAAQADGSLAALTQHLQAFDAAVHAWPGLPPADALRQQAAALHAERARLKGWQQWGGSRARDDLVAEAEVLARLVSPPPAPADGVGVAVASSDPVIGPVTGHLSDPISDPTTATDPAADAASAADIAANVASAADVAGDVAADSVADPVADSVADSVADPGPVVVPEPVADPVTDSSPDAAVAGFAQPAPDPSPEPASLKPVRSQPRQAAASAPKLDLKAHADAIASLRARWRELDRLGADASQTLWLRFDSALQAAYQPLVARQAAQKAARLDNLRAREALLATLDAVPGMDDASDSAAAPKEAARALDRFHTAWRQLGPAEHTVPPAARQALLARLRTSVERIELPLVQAQRAAQAQREQLLARAEALAADLVRQPLLPDAPAQVRALQAEWQQQARGLPLPRGLENALWMRFKAATDSVFEQRDAARGARDAEMAAQHAARDARAAQQRDHEVAQRQRWQAQCQALADRLALCAERERAAGAGAGTDADTGAGAGADPSLPQRWADAPELPVAWSRPLGQRWAAPVAAGPLSAATLDDLLLQLESALDLPATAEQQAARRLLKLRALKDTMEGRSSADTGPAGQAQALAAALRQCATTPVQQQRLLAVVAALGRAPSGALGQAPAGAPVSALLRG